MVVVDGLDVHGHPVPHLLLGEVVRFVGTMMLFTWPSTSLTSGFWRLGCTLFETYFVNKFDLVPVEILVTIGQVVFLEVKAYQVEPQMISYHFQELV